MKNVVVLLLIAFLTVGCASYGDYYKSVEKSNEYRASIEMAKYQAETARLNALAAAASNGDAATKSAAVMAIALSGGRDSGAAQVVQPQMPRNGALEWVQALAGPLVNLGIARYGMMTNINASDNARDVQISSHGAFTSFGDNIMNGTASGYPYINPTPVVAPDPVIVPTQLVPTQVLEPIIYTPTP